MTGAATPIDFYFDFSSPYGYIASQVVDDMEKRIGRPVKWRPTLLGVTFKIMGQVPLVEVPMKGDYRLRSSISQVPWGSMEPRSLRACSARPSSWSTAKRSGAWTACRWSRNGSVPAAGSVLARALRAQRVGERDELRRGGIGNRAVFHPAARPLHD
jgi:hypothetical protein